MQSQGAGYLGLKPPCFAPLGLARDAVGVPPGREERVMMIWKDMATGRRMEEPADAYGDEVLNANCLPETVAALALQAVEPEIHQDFFVPTDVDAFLADLYRNQE